MPSDETTPPATPPVRDIHADADVQTPPPPTVKQPQPTTEDDRCRNIHCSCHHS